MKITFHPTPARTIPALGMFLILVELGFLFLFKNQESHLVAFPGLLLGAGVIDLVGAVLVIFFAFWEVE